MCPGTTHPLSAGGVREVSVDRTRSEKWGVSGIQHAPSLAKRFCVIAERVIEDGELAAPQRLARAPCKTRHRLRYSLVAPRTCRCPGWPRVAQDSRPSREPGIDALPPQLRQCDTTFAREPGIRSVDTSQRFEYRRKRPYADLEVRTSPEQCLQRKPLSSYDREAAEIPPEPQAYI